MIMDEESFNRIIQETWKSTLGFEVDCAQSSDFPETGALTVGVKITGAWYGEVLLHCPVPLGRLIASVIFQVEAEFAGSAEIEDALSELVHIIGGNLKTLLPQPVAISFPSSSEPPDLRQKAPQWHLVSRLNLTSQGYPFIVAILVGPAVAIKGASPADRESLRPE